MCPKPKFFSTLDNVSAVSLSLSRWRSQTPRAARIFATAARADGFSAFSRVHVYDYIPDLRIRARTLLLRVVRVSLCKFPRETGAP